MKNNFLAVVILIFAAFLYRQKIMSWIGPRKIPTTIAQSGNCSGKNLCAIVYFAPWCPACHHYQPMIKASLESFENNQEHGIQVIMGMETQAGENERVAKEISEQVMIDTDKSLAKQMNITFFPTFLVVDQNRKVIHQDQEALQWIENH
jgi:thiol-disulfide isomerase/thioredoxin